MATTPVRLSRESGMSLIEVLVVVAILSITMLVFTSFFSNQLKSMNYLTFQGKKEQLRLVMIGQFLNDPNNCKCLFNGNGTPQTFSNTATSFSGVIPNRIGRFNFTTPGDCSTATIPQEFISVAGFDGLKLNSISVQNLTSASGIYQGQLTMVVSSIQDVAGPSPLQLKMPIVLKTVPVGSSQQFLGCSIDGGARLIPRCRVCIQLKDGGCMGTGSAGTPQCSEWSDKPGQNWTSFAGDSDSYDSDCSRVSIECQ